MRSEYHIQRNEPCLPHWPNGSWSVYRITGAEIADRTVRAEIVRPEHGGPAYYRGDVIARHSWCGYLGMTETFEGMCDLIKADQVKEAEQAAREARRRRA